MKKRKCLILYLLPFCVLTGCVKRVDDPGGERKAVEFTVVEEQKLPARLLQVIEKHKREEMRLLYEDGDDRYLIRGYGEQETGGYSIQVKGCEADDKTVYLETLLLGPQDAETAGKAPSCPYVVVQIKKDEKRAEIR